MIRAVLIDVDDTLLDFKRSAELSIRRSAEERGIEIPDDIIETFVRHNDGWWHRIERGEVTKSELREYRFTGIFKELGIVTDGPTFDDLFKKNLRDAYVKVDGAEQLLRYLSGYRLYVASNAHDEEYQRTRLSGAGLLGYFDGLFVSGAVGANKPTKEFFDRCMEVMKVEPREVVMIGDSLTADIEGAKAYGYHTVWFDKYSKGTGGEADHVVKSLYEIEDIFRRHYE